PRQAPPARRPGLGHQDEGRADRGAPRRQVAADAQRQPPTVASAPPASGPSAAMPLITDPQIPKAMARSRPVNTAFTVDSVAGRLIEAPTPCRARAPMSAAPPPARAAATLAAVNPALPGPPIRRRPNRSPARPNGISSAANTSAYTEVTHSASAVVSPRSVMILGRRTPTMVASTTMRETPRLMTTMPVQRRRPAGAAGGAAGAGVVRAVDSGTASKIWPGRPCRSPAPDERS